MTCLFFVGRLGGLSSGERKDLVLIVAAISPRWMGIVKGRFSIGNFDQNEDGVL